MKKYIKYLFLLYSSIIIISCTTKYVTVPLTSPPTIYTPSTIYTEKDLIQEYRRSIMKISEWQNWYNIQINTNYFYK